MVFKSKIFLICFLVLVLVAISVNAEYGYSRTNDNHEKSLRKGGKKAAARKQDYDYDEDEYEDDDETGINLPQGPDFYFKFGLQGLKFLQSLIILAGKIFPALNKLIFPVKKLIETMKNFSGMLGVKLDVDCV